MLQIGFGVADITPPLGADIPGGFFENPSKGVKDKLLAVACVIHDGQNTVALVGTDTLIIGRNVVEPARRGIQKITKIPGENVLIGASHTHSGGPITGIFGYEGDPRYVEQVTKGIESAVGEAWNSMHTSEIGIATGNENTISFNRRFLMRDGREITHPGKPGTPHHDAIVEPAGHIDPDVGVLAARPSGGKVSGIVVNFACHNTVVGGNEFSPDYVAYLRKHLKAHYGENTPVVFLLGPCGDITQVDNRSTAVEFGVAHADMMGMRLASAAVRAADRAKWLKEAPVAATTEIVPLAIRPEPDPEAERPTFGLGSDFNAQVGEIYARERKKVAEIRSKTPRIPCEVQALRIGPLGIVTNGSEYFCEYGLRIKRCSHFQPTWVVSLANEYIGYVPTSQAFVGGGYEPRTARSSKMAPEVGQRLVETALKALDKIKPKTPTP